MTFVRTSLLWAVLHSDTKDAALCVPVPMLGSEAMPCTEARRVQLVDLPLSGALKRLRDVLSWWAG